MKALRIICESCQAEWTLHAEETPYLELNIMSQPCPNCEAYTLSCVEGQGSPARHPRPRPTPPLPAR
jgi:hypothetical protein